MPCPKFRPTQTFTSSVKKPITAPMPISYFDNVKPRKIKLAENVYLKFFARLNLVI